MRTAILIVLLLAGCAVEPPVGVLRKVPQDTPQRCADICEGMGLQLSAVVVVASSAGCVCEAQPRTGNAVPGGASAASAGAVIVLQEEDQRRHQQQQQQQHRTSGVH